MIRGEVATRDPGGSDMGQVPHSYMRLSAKTAVKPTNWWLRPNLKGAANPPLFTIAGVVAFDVRLHPREINLPAEECGGARNAMVRLERFELPASWFVARRSIQLSYRRAMKKSMAIARRRAPRSFAFASGPPLLALRHLPPQPTKSSTIYAET
jgi:hypothetical protein